MDRALILSNNVDRSAGAPDEWPRFAADFFMSAVKRITLRAGSPSYVYPCFSPLQLVTREVLERETTARNLHLIREARENWQERSDCIEEVETAFLA